LTGSKVFETEQKPYFHRRVLHKSVDGWIPKHSDECDQHKLAVYSKWTV